MVLLGFFPVIIFFPFRRLLSCFQVGFHKPARCLSLLSPLSETCKKQLENPQTPCNSNSSETLSWTVSKGLHVSKPYLCHSPGCLLFCYLIMRSYLFVLSDLLEVVSSPQFCFLQVSMHAKEQVTALAWFMSASVRRSTSIGMCSWREWSPLTYWKYWIETQSLEVSCSNWVLVSAEKVKDVPVAGGVLGTSPVPDTWGKGACWESLMDDFFSFLQKEVMFLLSEIWFTKHCTFLRNISRAAPHGVRILLEQTPLTTTLSPRIPYSKLYGGLRCLILAQTLLWLELDV